MALPMSADRVVVVGAGVSGLAIARELAPDHEVVVLDKGGVAADTTSRASGMISLAIEPLPEAWIEFALSTYRDLDGEGIFAYTERETVRLVPSGGGGDDEEHDPEGGTALSVDELRERYPGHYGDLTGYDGGLVHEGTGFLDVPDYAMTLKWLAERHGARIYRDHEVTGLRVDDGAVAGVDTTYGGVDADHVVFATGWRAREQLSEHVELPVRPMRWNALVLDAQSADVAGAPLGSDPKHRSYWRPTRTGDLLVGGNEHLVEDPEGTEMAVQESFRDLVREQLVPMLAGVDGTVRRADCCPTADTASPDGRPIVDAPAEAPDGLVVATGVHGRGVMLSPVTGRAVRSLVTGEDAPFPMDPLRVDRFDDRSADFEYLSHWG